nr:MAG TPA: hypothetical protein [Caudoviricetes sp.]
MKVAVGVNGARLKATFVKSFGIGLNLLGRRR